MPDAHPNISTPVGRGGRHLRGFIVGAPEHIDADSSLVRRVGVYVELHVEQSRALGLVDKPIALASSIWPDGRWEFTFTGEAIAPERHDWSTGVIRCSLVRPRYTAHAQYAFRSKPTGMSHSPDEFSEPDDYNTDAQALADVMADWVLTNS